MGFMVSQTGCLTLDKFLISFGLSSLLYKMEIIFIFKGGWGLRELDDKSIKQSVCHIVGAQ